MADDKGVGEGDKKDAAAATVPAEVAKKKRKGFFSRMFTGIFRHRDDFEKRLQYLSKEEITVVNRINRRALTRRGITRNLIAFSIIFEVLEMLLCLIKHIECCTNPSIRVLLHYLCYLA